MLWYKFDLSRDPDSYRDIPGYKVVDGHGCDRGIGYYKSVLGAGAKVEERSDEIP